jgi:hypothetical protein
MEHKTNSSKIPSSYGLGIYQGRNGAIYLQTFGKYCQLTIKQIEELALDVAGLTDFDADAYMKFYSKPLAKNVYLNFRIYQLFLAENNLDNDSNSIAVDDLMDYCKNDIPER